VAEATDVEAAEPEPRTARPAFPPDFAWAVTTSAYQIEGAETVGGRGPSIWDTFSRRPGSIANGDTGAVAADHHARFREDVALMARLGIRAYRFSISWPRIQPAGTGPPLQAGLDFYRGLFDALDDAGIEPIPVLYHWDLPQALEDAGGWPVRDTAFRFADYAGHVADALGQRATRWGTVNEPWCSAFLGYCAGVHAPGRREPAAAIRAVHHLLLGHGLAAARIRAAASDRQVGIAVNLTNARAHPSADPERLADPLRRIDGLHNRLFLDPLLQGAYPADVIADLAGIGELPVQAGDLAIISAPLDWLGINYYSDREFVAADGRPSGIGAVFPGVTGLADAPIVDPTDSGWPVTPRGLGDVLIRLAADHPDVPPVLISENGAAYDDPVAADGSIQDTRRIAYLDAHIREVARARTAGVDVRGYSVWSLLDNFEWAEGYAKRFGLVHVDFKTQKRTPRASAAWYAGLIAANGPPVAAPSVAPRVAPPSEEASE
jgi:beta-glucosidase